MIGTTSLATQSRLELDITRDGPWKNGQQNWRHSIEKETTKSKSSPTSCSGNHDVMAKQVKTVVGKTLVGRGTSSACKRSRSQPSAFHQGQQPKAASTGRMYGSNLTFPHHRLTAWQNGGVRLEVHKPACRRLSFVPSWHRWTGGFGAEQNVLPIAHIPVDQSVRRGVLEYLSTGFRDIDSAGKAGSRPKKIPSAR
jgi:hypothetical protein